MLGCVQHQDALTVRAAIRDAFIIEGNLGPCGAACLTIQVAKQEACLHGKKQACVNIEGHAIAAKTNHARCMQ